LLVFEVHVDEAPTIQAPTTNYTYTHTTEEQKDGHSLIDNV